VTTFVESISPGEPSALIPFDQLLVVRTSAMGDIIHAMPAVAALRHAFPEIKIKIGWVVEKRWVELLCAPSVSLAGPHSPGRPLADRIHTVNTKAWRRSLMSPDSWRQISGSVRDLRAPHYETAVDFQGGVRSAVIARVSGAKKLYGFLNPRERVATRFYSQRVATSAGHVVEQNLALAESAAGRTLTFTKPELPRDEATERECDHYLKEHQIEKFILLNPGAGWGAKQWPAERYGWVAKQLRENRLRCLINYGPGEEALAAAAETASEGAADSIALSLTQLIAFTRRAALFIGGDTGPMHLAAALSVPVVAIFGPTDPARNGPFGTASIVLRSATSVTSHKRRAQPDEGLVKISVDEVVASARQLLRDARA
jgi:heptosyltransferase-1